MAVSGSVVPTGGESATLASCMGQGVCRKAYALLLCTLDAGRAQDLQGTGNISHALT